MNHRRSTPDFEVSGALSFAQQYADRAREGLSGETMVRPADRSPCRTVIASGLAVTGFRTNQPSNLQLKRVRNA